MKAGRPLSAREGGHAAALDRASFGAVQVASSWRRSLELHGIDPASREPPRILTATELKDHRAPLEMLAALAQEEIARLYSVVGRLAYALALAAPTGAVVDCRGNPAEADGFTDRGLCLGALWSEAAEGTNGIGTAIVERHPLTIHRMQHFRARHADLSCSAAPIFDPQARLAGVLDVTSMDPQVSDRAHAMALAVATESARAIEERLFRDRYRSAWTLGLTPGLGTKSVLLAVDGDHRIIGADRRARAVFALDDRRLAEGISLWALFEKAPGLLCRHGDGDRCGALTYAATGGSWRALVTAPLVAARRRSDTLLHSRPRANLLDAPAGPPAPGHQGGLSAAVLRRVKGHIAAHLGEKLSVQGLAEIAGLSVYHFARQFKNSVGVSPHLYLLQARIDQAKQRLIASDAPISDIAAELGFSDSSRFANQFRRMVGVTPSAFRRRKP